uniref:Sulfotransferase n=1 Tax=Phyllostachys edulis TaxID=38705 RepID=D3IVN1_PHYED|nr:putative flavonol 3-sulfotransferase [Phyllostachys edulis]
MAQAQCESNDNGAAERESLVSTLPTRQGWWKPFVLYRSSWLTPQVVKSAMLVQAQFEPRPDDIILATFPKCGTTWLKALAFTTISRSRHAVTGDGHPLLTNHPQDLVPFLELPHRELHPLADLETITSPRLLSTHMPLALLPPRVSTLGCRVVYLCREPKDVLVSGWHYANKVRKDFCIELDRSFELFCEGVSLFGPIWEHYLGYWKESMADPDRVLFLKYDEMMADPMKHVKMLAEFFRVPFTDAEESGGVVEEVVRLCSFEKLKSLPVNSSGVSDRIGGLPMENSSFFRAGKVRDWASHLTEEMAKKLDCIVEEKMKGSGLTF